MLVKKWLKVSLFAVLLGMAGCVYMPSPRSQSIAELKTVPGQCVLLGEVQGKSYFSLLSAGLEVAKARAKLMASSLGATHVQWVEINSSIRATVTAKAYRCPVHRQSLIEEM